jgi:two-component system response regulator YesN
MYKVLIADDEEIILKGLSALINWEGMGTELVGTADNGEVAYTLIQQHQPEIVISDIKMPGMDGLELIRRVRRGFPDIQFIILSGFDEFDFAKQAMEHGVKHYLLKPFSEVEIANSLKVVVKELEDSRHRTTSISKTKHDLEKVLPQVKEQVLKEFLTNKTYGSKDWEYYTQLFGLKTPEKHVQLILFEIEGEYEFEYLDALKNIATEILDSGCGIVLSTTIGDRAVILIENQFQEALVEKLKEVQQVFFNYYHLEITVAVSNSGKIDKLRVLYKGSLEILTHRFYLGEGSIITHLDIASTARQQENVEFNHEDLVLGMQSGNVERVEHYMKQFFGRLKRHQHDIDGVKSYIFDLYMIVIRESVESAVEERLKKTAMLQSLSTLDQIEAFVRNSAVESARRVYDLHNQSQNQLIRRMLQYIHEHLNDESMSLVKLANDVLFMNTEYLGRLFRKETGEKFTNYLVHARIEKAKQLIEHADEVKISDIAEQVGFGNNPQYFSQVFKKRTGSSPTEYKKGIH